MDYLECWRAEVEQKNLNEKQYQIIGNKETSRLENDTEEDKRIVGNFGGISRFRLGVYLEDFQSQMIMCEKWRERRKTQKNQKREKLRHTQRPVATV